MSLQAKMDGVRDTIEGQFRGPHGILYSAINEATRKIYTKEELARIAGRITRDTRGYADPAGYMANEDSCIATGIYLQSQADCFVVTGHREAANSCKKSFEAIDYVFELGKEWKEGWICKPFNCRFSRTSSIDQHLFVAWGLDAYYEIASEAVRRRIVHMLKKIADFFIDVDYVFRYFGTPDDWLLNMAESAAGETVLRIPHSYYCPVFSLLAWKHTGRQRYEKEYRRLLALGCGRFPDLLPKAVQRGYHWGTPGWLMTGGSFDAYAKHDEGRKDEMAQHAQALFRHVSISLRDDGTNWLSLYYRPQDDSWQLPETPAFLDGCNEDMWCPVQYWMSKALSNAGTSFKMLTLIAQHAADLRQAIVPKVLKGLQQFSDRDALWCNDTDGRQIPAQFSEYAHTLMAWGYAGALFAYWRGRRLGFWQ